MTPYERMAHALKHGGNFCIGCQRLVELENAGEPNQCCADCGSHRVRWLPPVLQFTPLPVAEPIDVIPL